MAEPTLTRQVLDRLGSDIVTGAIPSGAVLRTQDLQVQFDVSRSVIRDVLRSLKSMNLVQAKRSVGITIRPPQDWDMFAKDVIRWRLASADWRRQLQSLAVVRAAIEPVAAGLAARTPDHAEVGTELSRIAATMREAGERGDLDVSLDADIHFHLLILRRCGNEMLAALDEVVEQVLRARHELRLRPEHPHQVPMVLHQLVATAIGEGDPAAAEAAMRLLVVEVIEDVARQSGTAALTPLRALSTGQSGTAAND